MAHDRVHIILSHEKRCPERNQEDIRMKIYLRKLTDQERIQHTRENRRRGYQPPIYVKERYECPHAAAGECALVQNNPDACPVYRSYQYYGFVN